MQIGDPNETIKDKVSKLKARIPIFIKKHPDPNQLNIEEYIILIFSINSIFLIEDVLILIEEHKQKRSRTKRGLYTILRNILELYFYFRYITNKKDSMDLRFRAFYLKSEKSEGKLFSSFLGLNSKNKFIFSEDPKRVTSEVFIRKRILDIEENEKGLLAEYGDELKKELDIMKSLETVCKKYDEENNILSIEKDKEYISLEWCYNFLYRFQSMFTHQGLRTIEEVIHIYFQGKEKDNEDLDTLTLLDPVISDYLKNFNKIAK